MLVLKRKVGETVMIGDHIRVQILAVEGDTVKMGFTAPKDVEILRAEIYETIREENLKAGKQQITGKNLKDILGNLLDEK